MSRTLIRLRSRVLRPMALAGALVFLAVLVSGCALIRRTPADPLADYRPSLGPRFAIDNARLAALQQYSITVQVNPAARAYTGTLDLTFPVTGTVALNELYFRLYPNLTQFDGHMDITSAGVDGKTVNYSYAADGTAVHLVFPQPLKAGSRPHVRLGFTGQAPQHGNLFYTLFGKSKDILSLAAFYPMLPARRGGDWVLDVANPQGDVGFEEAALFRVDVTAPPDQVIAATGTLVGQAPAAGGNVTSRYVLGPGREFALLMSPRFEVREEEAYGTRVRSYYLPEDADTAASALYDAVAALQIYSDQFGPYPYSEMAVVEAPLTFRGQEFPGMSLIGSEDYGKQQEELEKLVSHEVAHQWWYNQVGSDQTQTPWLDEGLAEFTMYYYYLLRHGQDEADLLRLRRWEAPVQFYKDNGRDAPIGGPVTSYEGNYETIVYAKGALFFATLRDQLGAQTFDQVLRTYLAEYQWRIATPDDLRRVAEQVSGKDLKALFAQWVDGAGE